MDQTLMIFGLTKEQLRLMFSFQCYMVKQDAEREKGFIDNINPFVASHENRLKWYQSYKANLELFLSQQQPEESYNTLLPTTFNMKSSAYQLSKKYEVSLWKYLIFLECVLFQPYFPLSEKDKDNKTYKGLKLDSDIRKECLNNIADGLNIDRKYVKIFQKEYENNIKTLNGSGTKIAIAVGAGIVAALLVVATAGGSIAALFAAEGLYGAAAISSGLAALGGGAVAVGGLGMAGGIAVLAGGGVLLGGGAGAGVGMALASTSPDTVMSEAAKIMIVIKEVLINIMHDKKRVTDIIITINERIIDLQKRIDELELEDQKTKEKIKELKKAFENQKMTKERIAELELEIKKLKKIIENLQKTIKYLKKIIYLWKKIKGK